MEKIFDEFRKKLDTLKKNLEFLEKNIKKEHKGTVFGITACFFRLEDKVNLEIYRLSTHKINKLFSIDDFTNMEIDEEYLKEKTTIELYIEIIDQKYNYNRLDEIEEKIEELDKNHKISDEDLKLSVYKLVEEFSTIFINLKKRVSVLQKLLKEKLQKKINKKYKICMLHNIQILYFFIHHLILVTT